MSRLERRLVEDRALRDAALELFKADIAFIRSGIRERGVGARLADRLGEGTRDMVDEAADYAEANKGVVAAGLAALVLWFARGPILKFFAGLMGDDEEAEDDATDDPGQYDENEEPSGHGDRSHDN